MPVDMSGQHFGMFQQALARAKKLEEAGDFPRAAIAYREASAHYTNYASFGSPAVRAERLKTAQQYKEHAGALANRQNRPQQSQEGPERGGSGDSEESGELRNTILGLIEQGNVGWDEIGGLEQTKHAIKLAYGLALAKKPTGLNLRGGGNFLFYGPPGTGKSRLAAATSTSLEATFFNVKVSSILSKFFGESSKLIGELYKVAREMAPSVVFIDELESLAPPRGGDESGSERRILSTLLVELQGMSQQRGGGYVVTIGATNVPWLMDEAILSRFERKIYVPLPDQAAREAILKIHLSGFPLAGGVSYQLIARNLDGFSGREIEQFCARVTSQIIDEMNPDLVGKVDLGKSAVENYTLAVRPATQADFAGLVRRVRPGTGSEFLARMEQWRQRIES